MQRPKQAIVSYVSDDIWTIVYKELQSRLPLRSLLCQTRSSNTPNKIIPVLNVEFKRYQHDQFPRTGTGGFIQNPYFLHLFITSCDADEYKNIIKRQLQDWLNVVTPKKHQEWMIVHISNVETKGKTFMGIPSGGSLPDRIKSDISSFNPSKKDRVLSLRVTGNESKDFELWNDLVLKIKDGITSSFNMQIAQADEDTRKLDQQRLMPGWNYCQFFIMKESLAFTSELMNLFQEALVHYDELEAGFFQTLSEQALPWFKKFGGNQGDDSNDILDFTLKPYREEIYQNSITIFDFRIYLFARQCTLLLRLDQPNEVLMRAHEFITSFSLTLDEYKASLSPFFKESWVYSACVNVLKYCDDLAENLVAPASMQYESYKCLILHMARIQLDKLGIIYEKLNRPIHCFCLEINQEDWSNVVNTDFNGDQNTFIHSTNKELKLALTTTELFDDLYTKITLLAIESFKKCSQFRMVQVLLGDLANLYYSRGKHAMAAEIWEDLCADYLKQGWTNIGISGLERLAICQKGLKNYSKYVVSCFYLIQNPQFIYLKRVIDYTADLNKYSQIMETESSIEDSDVFGLKMGLNFDEIILALKGNDFKTVSCRTTACTINPGDNTFRLIFDEFSNPGYYKPTDCEFNLGKFKLKIPMLDALKYDRMFISENTSALHVSLGVPHTLDYQKPIDSISIKLATKNVKVKELMVNVQSLSGMKIPTGNELELKRVRSLDGQFDQHDMQTTSIHDANGMYFIPECVDHYIYEFLIPCQLELESNSKTLKVTVDYKTEDNISHFYNTVFSFSSNLPFEITHKWILAQEKTLLNVYVVSNNQTPLKINAFEIQSKNGKISTIAEFHTVTIFKSQTYSFLFEIPFEDFSEDLTIRLQYQDPFIEIESFLLSELQNSLLLSSNGICFFGFLANFIRQNVMPKIDMNYFCKWNLLEMEDYCPKLSEILEKEKSQFHDVVCDLMHDFYKRTRRICNDNFNKLIIESRVIFYDVKSINDKIKISAEIKLESNENLVVNDKIRAKLIFVRETLDITVQFRYELAIIDSDWMMTGKRSQLITFDTEVKRLEFDFVLIPLKAGDIHLPKNLISPNDDFILNLKRAANQITIFPESNSGRLFLADFLAPPVI